ncbi:hypothetical protein QBC33DRAFT_543947 [Phialemonium atrogriseum]|uniref:LysM domain-containing protein n=1 Tax=Phialemonium atrogriseum TaxID=1093897 RepID=A0AAJ0BWX8_9PEZI|nr:uncharacterized protein QBC33DRAFT_543947 [Phialemonium atrogriseum]KAK1765781.1 hypothetical protein QBC33DRAFT_543947 [Phialemonium atrogriseum]
MATTMTTTMTTPMTATTTTHPSTTLQQPAPQSPEDTLHILDHTHDTIPSLSLRYGIPAPALRLANRLTSDHLLAARRAILIPGGGPHQRHHHHQSPSSLDPAAAASDEARKARIRRWMVATKVPDYDVAVLYLEQAGHDLDAAVDAYFADEAWERENPNPDPVGGRSRGRGRGGVLGEIGSWWAGQAGFLRRS